MAGCLKLVLQLADGGIEKPDPDYECGYCGNLVSDGHTDHCIVPAARAALATAAAPAAQWSQEWPTKEGWYHRWEVGRQVESYFLPINEIQSDMARKYMIDYWWLPATGRYQVPEPPKPAQEGGR